MNQNIENLIKYLDLSEVLGVEEIKLNGCDIRLLNEHLRTLYEQKKQLTALVKYLNKDLVNMTKELEEIKL